MAIIFTEGFDKYGPAAASATGTVANSIWTAASKGIWTVTGANNPNTFIGPPLASAGIGSLVCTGNFGTPSTPISTVALGQNCSKAIGGIYMQINTLRSPNTTFEHIRFLDSGTLQAAIGINGSGNVVLYNAAGSIIGTSVGTITTGTAFLLEWNLTMSNSAAYNVYLNGVSVISGSGANFHGSANNFYQQIALQSLGSGTQSGSDMQFDHMYVDDGTGSPLLAQTVIETHFPSSDSAVTFAVGAYGLGFQNSNGTGTNAPGANELVLRKVTPGANTTLNSITIVPSATSATANFKAVLYADSSGPAGLTATGTQVTGTTAGSPLTLPFSAGQSLTGGTSYWIGYITDTSVALYESDTGTTGWTKSNTYASGAPNPAGVAGSTTAANWIMWGNCTTGGSNNAEVAEQVPYGAWGDFSYVDSSTVSNEDLYGMTALSSTPATIYSVSVSVMLKDTTAGSRTVSVNTKSGGTDSTGSLTAVTPGTSYGWSTSYWLVDPNTSSAWTAANLNAALAGYKIQS